MGTKSISEDEASGWPWSALGLAPTTDREAIGAAYAARRAALDAEVMRVSAFAELSEAREKALFLAAEMRRAIERGEERERTGLTSAGKASPFAPPVLPSTPVPPTPPPQAPPPELPPPRDVTPESPKRPQPTELPELARVSVPLVRDEPMVVEPQPPFANDTEQTSAFPTLEEEAREIAEKLNLKKFWPFYVVPALFLISMCSANDDGDYDVPEPTQTITRPPLNPSPRPEQASAPAVDPNSTNAMVAALFGPTFDYPGLVDMDTDLAWQLARVVQSDDPEFEIPRSQLRIKILGARKRASREQALSIAELHLAWLQTAQAQESGGCSEVTSELFFDGIPKMRDDWVRFEQSLAVQLARAGVLPEGRRAQSSSAINPLILPEWAIDEAENVTGLESAVFADAMEEMSHPARCEVEIALLQAMLARRDDVTPAMIAAL